MGLLVGIVVMPGDDAGKGGGHIDIVARLLADKAYPVMADGHGLGKTGKQTVGEQALLHPGKPHDVEGLAPHRLRRLRQPLGQRGGKVFLTIADGLPAGMNSKPVGEL